MCEHLLFSLWRSKHSIIGRSITRSITNATGIFIIDSCVIGLQQPPPTPVITTGTTGTTSTGKATTGTTGIIIIDYCIQVFTETTKCVGDPTYHDIHTLECSSIDIDAKISVSAKISAGQNVTIGCETDCEVSKEDLQKPIPGNNMFNLLLLSIF